MNLTEPARVIVEHYLKFVVPTDDDIECWLDDLQTQLDHFAMQRDDADAEGYLKHFTTLPHLFWWTVASLNQCQSHNLMLINDITMPAQANSFLSFIDDKCYNDDTVRDACYEVLSAAYNEFVNDASIFDEEHTETVDDTRKSVTQLFSRLISDDTFTSNLENACHLYACMNATVDTKADDLTLNRWRFCYGRQVAKMTCWLETCPGVSLIDDTRYALLLPFTKRSFLFRETRAELFEKLQAKIVSDKRVFDRDNDHTSIVSDFKCPKCGSFNTQKFMKQLRSADEPMTTFWRCYKCNKSGREN